MSKNVTFCVRWNKGDSSSENEEMDDALEVEVVADRSNISRQTGKSEIHEEKCVLTNFKYKPESWCTEAAKKT